MEPLPRLKTNRLLLSQPTANDIPFIVQYAANKRVSDYTNLPYPYSEQDAIYWINLANQGYKQGTHHIFAIRLKPRNNFIGGIALTIEQQFKRADIGYWLAEPYWNQGYTTEATKAIMHYGFDQLSLNKLTSSHLDQNPASGRVILKSGLLKEGELKEHICKQSMYHSLLVYGLTKQDYQRAKTLDS